MAWRAALRAGRPLRLQAYSTRSNSTFSYAARVLSDPVIETIALASRITRILLGSALVVGGVTLASWEGMHQYVERVSMPQAASQDFHSGDAMDNDFEFAADDRPDALLHMRHTDPRLGTFGRHIVRAAWMAEHWGGGIAPGVLFGGGSSRPVPTDALDHNGLAMAETFLASAVDLAEKRHMSVPDFAQPGTPVDPTAVSLELWLAHIREKMGSPMALTRAANACEKLFDASSDPVLRRSLATRLATQCSRLGQWDESVRWMDRAMQESAHDTLRATVDKLLARESLPLTPLETRQSIETLQALSTLHVRQATAAETERAPLEEALRIQLAALRLANTSTVGQGVAGTAERLQELWIQQRQAVLAMHVAETLYALHKEPAVSAGWWPRLSHWLGRASRRQVRPLDYFSMDAAPVRHGPHAASQEWLWCASQRAQQVCRELGTSGSEMLPAWKGPYQAMSARVLEQAQRTQQEAELLLRALQK
ncbi:hypothetical protein MCAP1_000249 [Malassezia caprae]|uniref:Uncharacterized protein n=1 Tax=Malassezia caprae TaxID=1381934 RepID=A0AAF0IUU2_9BASI|nr:hypothetical protein MCAP1_000249 [Malassezia caprae]